MLLTNVVLVLREMLEAALIVSVLLAWSVIHDGGRGWLRSALATGMVYSSPRSREGRMPSGAYSPICRPLMSAPVSYTHLRAHQTVLDIVCRLLLEKKKTLPAPG